MKMLVIDDDLIVLMTMRKILESENYYVDTASYGQEGLKKFSEEKYNFVFLDLNLPDKHGVEVLKEIKKMDPAANVIIITGYSRESSEAVMKLNAFDFIEKPLCPNRILKSIMLNSLKS